MSLDKSTAEQPDLKPPKDAPVRTMSDRDFQQRILDDLAELKDGQTELKHIITGNGEPEKGLAFRLAMMEKSQKKQSWFLKTVLGAMIVAAVTYAVDRATSHSTSQAVENVGRGH